MVNFTWIYKPNLLLHFYRGTLTYLKCISKIKTFYSYLNKWVPGILKHKLAYQNAGLTNSISHGTAFFSGNFSASIVLSLTETDGGWAYFLLCLSITRYLIHNIHTILHSPEIHNASSYESTVLSVWFIWQELIFQQVGHLCRPKAKGLRSTLLL